MNICLRIPDNKQANLSLKTGSVALSIPQMKHYVLCTVTSEVTCWPYVYFPLDPLKTDFLLCAWNSVSSPGIFHWLPPTKPCWKKLMWRTLPWISKLLTTHTQAGVDGSKNKEVPTLFFSALTNICADFTNTVTKGLYDTAIFVLLNPPNNEANLSFGPCLLWKMQPSCCDNSACPPFDELDVLQPILTLRNISDGWSAEEYFFRLKTESFYHWLRLISANHNLSTRASKIRSF